MALKASLIHVLERSQFASDRDYAYHVLKVKLLTLELLPGTVVDINDLSADIGIGRTPLMEAIRRLAQEDLLDVHPRRGTIVSEPSLAQARHLFEVRDILEGRAARLAALRGSEEKLQELRKLVDQQLRERDNVDYTRFLIDDYDLHSGVAHLSENPLLVRMLDHLLALNIRLWFVFFRVQGPNVQYLFSHKPIFDAIADRNPDAAEAAAIAHANESNTILAEVLRTQIV